MNKYEQQSKCNIQIYISWNQLYFFSINEMTHIRHLHKKIHKIIYKGISNFYLVPSILLQKYIPIFIIYQARIFFFHFTSHKNYLYSFCADFKKLLRNPLIFLIYFMHKIKHYPCKNNY